MDDGLLCSLNMPVKRLRAIRGVYDCVKRIVYMSLMHCILTNFSVVGLLAFDLRVVPDECASVLMASHLFDRIGALWSVSGYLYL
jgi:hypothetical protein